MCLSTLLWLYGQHTYKLVYYIYEIIVFLQDTVSILIRTIIK